MAQVAFEGSHLEKPRRYTLWKVMTVPEPIWQVMDHNWTPTRIRLPPRKWPASPLGDLSTFIRKNYLLILERLGLNWLRLESYPRYPLGGVIKCPRPKCDATFAERSQWKRHLDDTEHGRLRYGLTWSEDPMRGLPVSTGTPAEEKAAMEARKQRIHADQQQSLELQRCVGRGWSEEGTGQSRLFEEQFFAQLREENFAAPGELRMGPDDPTNQWIDRLHEWFDPTHDYYCGEVNDDSRAGLGQGR
jgi:hypothetical protein